MFMGVPPPPSDTECALCLGQALLVLDCQPQPALFFP